MQLTRGCFIFGRYSLWLSSLYNLVLIAMQSGFDHYTPFLGRYTIRFWSPLQWFLSIYNLVLVAMVCSLFFCRRTIWCWLLYHGFDRCTMFFRSLYYLVLIAIQCFSGHCTICFLSLYLVLVAIQSGFDRYTIAFLVAIRSGFGRYIYTMILIANQ